LRSSEVRELESCRTGGAAGLPEKSRWYPAADVAEREDGFKLRLDLPGIDRKDVKVSVHEGTVTVRGQRKEASGEEGESLRRVERVYGSFERRFGFRTALDASKVKAVYKDGVLEVFAPKAESAKAREVNVEIGE
jgi:HSP20 family protein